MSKSENQTPKHVAVIGAGLAGTMMASLLNKLGFRVSVFEKRSEEVEEKSSSEFGFSTSATKRSINLALSYRGIEALKELNLVDKVLENAIPMPKRVIHGPNGSIKTQPYGIGDQCLYSVGRGTINNILRDHLLAIGAKVNTETTKMVEMFYGYYLQEASPEGRCVFVDHHQNHLLTATFDLVIGADGAFSAVRDNLIRSGRINFARQYIRHGYKELTIPAKVLPNGTKTYALPDPEGLHIWPHSTFMLIALPNPDYTFTATLFAPYAGFDSFEYLNTLSDAALLAYFQHNFPDILPLIPNLIQEYHANPVGSLQTLKVDPWNHGKLMLIGDAAHAVVPFFGQGMNAAFQDAYMFYALLSEYLTSAKETEVTEAEGPSGKGTGKGLSVNTIDFTKYVKEFVKDRIPATNALADLCLEHYHDMAQNTTSSWYLLRKQVESWLYAHFPQTFIPLYPMIAFTSMPYHIAIARAHRQDRWIQHSLWYGVSLIIAGGGLLGWSGRERVLQALNTVWQQATPLLASWTSKK